MQRQTVRNAIVKTLIIGSALMVPLVSYAAEHNMNKTFEVSYNINGRKEAVDRKSERGSIINSIFDAAKNRRSKVVLNPMDMIEGYDAIETRSVFSDSWCSVMEKGISQGNSFFKSISDEMMRISLEKTGGQWGFCLTENGITIRHKKDKEINLEVFKVSSAMNFMCLMDNSKTRVYHSKMKEYDFSWIAARCERTDQTNTNYQYLVLAFNNLYPGTPESELKVLASTLRLPPYWKVIDESSFMGITACDALTPSAYFVVEDIYKNRHEIVMLGDTYIKDKPRKNVQVYMRDADGTILEVK